jgi:aspartate aminotransferase
MCIVRILTVDERKLHQTPKWICDAANDAIAKGFTKYVNPSGTPDIKQAIATHFSKTRSVEVGPERVVVGPGAKPGLWFGVQAVVSAGDEILCPDPGFPSYENMAKVFGCIPTRYDALATNVDVELAKHITNKTKVVILNSPSNPTGRVLSREELERIARVLSSHPSVWIVSDEIYCHLTYEDTSQVNADADEFPTTPSIASISGMLDRTIVVDGFSKAFQMTGWRLGFVVCQPALAQRLHLLMTHAVGCTASFTQAAGVAALTHRGRGRDLADVVVEYRKRRDYVVERMNAMPGVKCNAPVGAFYAFADVSAVGIPAREFCDRCLREGHVAILPGGDFGPKGENFVRISYVGDLSVLKDGMDRIEKIARLVQEELQSPKKKVKNA